MMIIFKVQAILDMLSDTIEDRIFYSFKGFVINPSAKHSELMHLKCVTTDHCDN